MSIWKQIKEVSATGTATVRLPYLVPGEYSKLKVTQCKTIQSVRSPGKLFFVVDFEVLDSDTDLKEAAWLVDLSYGEVALRDVKGFASSIMPQVEITEEVMQQIESPDQPASGILVSATASSKITQSGGTFTKVVFRPFAGEGEVVGLA